MASDKILIVGAGPVGLTLAIALARHGLTPDIIDKQPQHADTSRAVGVHARTLEIFEDLGLLEQAQSLGTKVNTINLYAQNQRLLQTHYQGFDTPHCYILDLPQSASEPLLVQRLQHYAIKVMRNVELIKLEQHTQGVNVTLKTEQQKDTIKQYDWVVGCDGANSHCREQAQIPFPGKEYPHYWAVLDATLIWPYVKQEMHLFMHKQGVIGVFPLPHGKARIACELSQTNRHMPPPTLTYETILALLHERISPDIQWQNPEGLSPFIIHHRHVTTYRNQRVFLAGDAAHLHSPAGGQGMNTGIQDAYNLAWKLAMVCQNIAHSELLDTYQIERKPIAAAVLRRTEFLTNQVAQKNPILRILTAWTIKVLGQWKCFSSALPKQLSGLTLRYLPHHQLYQETKHPPTKVTLGCRAPDHRLMYHGNQTRLFDLFQGTHYSILLFSGKSKDTENHGKLIEIFYFLQKHYRAWIQAYFVLNNSAYVPLYHQFNHYCLCDQTFSAHQHYGVQRPTVYIIRPDGYISFINEPPTVRACKDYLSRIFKQQE